MSTVCKGFKAKNVEETQWWLGDIFIELCENKEIVDPNIYSQIIELKDEISNNISNFLIGEKKKRVATTFRWQKLWRRNDRMKISGN